MAIIVLVTYIEAPIEQVFDLARDIDLHKLSTKQTKEEAIAGRTTGLIELGETVTWKAVHFGISQKLTVQITSLERPHMFVDKMLNGIFSKMEHKHEFEKAGTATRMTDTFEFASPLGFLGKAVDYLFLRKYMTDFLLMKNEELKRAAEGGN